MAFGGEAVGGKAYQLISEAEAKRRAAYGKGLADGMRIASEGGRQVSAVPAKTAEDGLTGLSRKVYCAVPISEAWTATQICAELRRTGVSGADRRAVDSCLHLLSERKLLKETARGTYMRAAVKTKPQPMEKAMPTPNVVQMADKAPPQANEPDGLGKLAAIAGTLRRLADQVETAALELEEKAAMSQEDAVKLRQLQALLKSIG